MKITIDKAAGFCPGVKLAIKKADQFLEKEAEFHCLGSLLHNEMEMGRLSDDGLKIVEKETIPLLEGKKLLFRAHGEPPETYDLTKENDVEVIDATCSVVRKLQKDVKSAAEEMEKLGGQVVIFGKPQHPEVMGLMGHTKGLGVVIRAAQDLAKVDMSRPVRLFSQTTMDDISFELIAKAIKEQMERKNPASDLESYNTICKHVLNRVPLLKKFASEHELIIFVSGRESSNGKKLFNTCLEVNPGTHFISETSEMNAEWFAGMETVGISGAASTPQWLMKEVAKKIEALT